MTILLGIATFIIVLAVLILVHELGHFSVAKLMNVRVEEFGLGFPPRLKAWRRGETVYSLNAVPIGGFVRMLGENGDTTDPRSFGSQAPWRRFLILVAGPSMNLLLAVTIYFFVFMAGVPQTLSVVTQVEPNSPAAQARLQPGDRIVQIDGFSVKHYDDLHRVIAAHLGERVSVLVVRGRHVVHTSLIPRINAPPNQGPMGVGLSEYETVTYGPIQSTRLAVGQVGAFIASIPDFFQKVGQHGGSGVTGPIGIARVTTEVVKQEPSQGFASLLQFVAFLSVNLGILNLLPIPALDGGRIFFVLVSWIRRRNLDPELESLIHMAGMAALLLLIMVISYHDLARWISGGSF